MQNRQLIREQFGILEEKLEELSAFARDGGGTAAMERVGSGLLVQDALLSLQELSRLVHDQQLLKSVPASEFLIRICTMLVQDAARLGVNVSISHFGEGKISMESAEIVLAAVVSGFRTSLRNHRASAPAERARQHLFPTGSIYLEVRSTPGEIQFRLLDDGLARNDAADGGRSFDRLREHIARSGGWFGYKSFSQCGGLIEFKVPLTHNRMEALILRAGDFEALVPSSCVAEILPAGNPSPKNETAFRLDETEGLIVTEDINDVHVRIGIADQQFWIGCDSATGPFSVRKVSAESFVEPSCWMQNLGVFPDGGHARALPLLDGPSLLKTRNAAEGVA